MANASDFPITFPYGATSAPYGTPQSPYHRGTDRAMPEGTPVVVNGVQIGLSGRSGWATGPHLHIGRFVNGRDTNPGNGGFNFNSAVVTQVAEDATNGKYVRVQADGASWVYLHMSQPTCSAGQVLSPPAPPAPAPPTTQNNYQGANEMIVNTDQAVKVYRMLRPNGGASQDEINNTAGRRSFANFINDAQKEIEQRDTNLRNQSQHLSDLQNLVNQLQAQDEADKKQIQDVTQKLNDTLRKVQDLQTALPTPTPLKIVQSQPGANPVQASNVNKKSLITKLVLFIFKPKK
jgi:hypothetical protein